MSAGRKHKAREKKQIHEQLGLQFQTRCLWEDLQKLTEEDQKDMRAVKAIWTYIENKFKETIQSTDSMEAMVVGSWVSQEESDRKWGTKHQGPVTYAKLVTYSKDLGSSSSQCHFQETVFSTFMSLPAQVCSAPSTLCDLMACGLTSSSVHGISRQEH